MAEENQDKKIKELEESLARELDQQVNLSNPTDSRIEGTVELNPDLRAPPKKDPPAAPVDGEGIAAANVGTYEPVPKAREPEAAPAEELAPALAAPAEGEVSLEDLDKILSQEMPDLQKELEALKEAGSDPATVGVDLSQFDVDENAIAPIEADGEGLPKRRNVFLMVKGWVIARFNATMDFFYRAPIQFYKYSLKLAKDDIPNIIAGGVQRNKARVKWAGEAFELMTLAQKLALAGLILVCVALVTLLVSPLGPIAVGRIDLHEGFQEGFDQQIPFDTKAKFVPLSEEGEYPEFVVLLGKLVVNIRRSQNSGPNPMVAARLYFELSTREGAIELKDREKEMRDLAQRVLEGFSYDQVASPEGKKTLKESLRREVSSILNNGVIRNIYIDDILIKP